MDLAGKSGGNIATKEVVAAVGRQPDLSLSLVCPRPERDLPATVATHAENVWYLPTKPAGTVRWHARSQVAMARILPRAYRTVDPDLVVARVGPSTVLTPLSTTLSRTPYVVLIRGMVGRNLRFGTVVDGIVRANAFLADEAYVAFQAIIDRYGLDSLTRASVFSNAVDPQQFRPVPRTEARAAIDAGFDDDDFVVGFVGSLKRRHRVEVLLQSVADLPEEVSVQVLVVGDGPQRAELEALVEERALSDAVTFTGFVPHEDLLPYIGSCDVTYGVVDDANPSNPIKCYEYLACERPVVTSLTDELAFVEREVFGVGIETVDRESVRDAIRSLWERGDETLAEMGRRGREYVVENHTWDRLADRLAHAAQSQ
jgi:glycosyltransferase involved in cell wall biosynthesis